MRRCTHCTQPLAPDLRIDAAFCSAACRRARWRRRTRTAHALAQPHKCGACQQRIVVVSKRRTPATARPPVASVPTASARPRRRARRTSAISASGWHRQTAPRGSPTSAQRRCGRSQPRKQPPSSCPTNGSARCPPSAATASASSSTASLVVLSSMATNTARTSASGGATATTAGSSPCCAALAAIGRIRTPPASAARWTYYRTATRLVTATVDAEAGEVGTIYQACGFEFVGVMRQGGRAHVRVNGKSMSERQAAASRARRALTPWRGSALTRARPPQGTLFCIPGPSRRAPAVARCDHTSDRAVSEAGCGSVTRRLSRNQ